jgi:phage major head subunit gpT-like protein
MGVINNAIVLEKGLRADFMKALEAAENPEEVMPMILKIPSKSNKENYGWLGNIPQLNEWLDERKLNGLKDYDYEIPNKSYEGTLQVDRDSLEDDQIGAIKTRIQDLAVRAKQHPRKLFFELLAAGDTDLCYDGQAFFSASHVSGKSGTQSNIVTGTGTSYAQIEADFDSAVVAMSGYKDDQGEPFSDGEMKLTVICSKALAPKFRKLNTAESLDGGATNTFKGQVEKIISSTRLSGNDWYLINTAAPMKPFIMQERQAAKFESQTNGERAFMSKRLLYGVDYRVGFGYGLWQYAVKVNN